MLTATNSAAWIAKARFAFSRLIAAARRSSWSVMRVSFGGRAAGAATRSRLVPALANLTNIAACQTS